MSDITFPTEVTVKMTVDETLADLDFDPDCNDEESIDLLDLEIGSSMESFEVESMEHLHELMQSTYKRFVIVDQSLAEHYSDWAERLDPSPHDEDRNPHLSYLVRDHAW